MPRSTCWRCNAVTKLSKPHAGSCDGSATFGEAASQSEAKNAASLMAASGHVIWVPVRRLAALQALRKRCAAAREMRMHGAQPVAVTAHSH